MVYVLTSNTNEEITLSKATLSDLKAALVEYDHVAVPETPTKQRVAFIGATIQGTVDRVELTYDDIAAITYRVAIEPEIADS